MSPGRCIGQGTNIAGDTPVYSITHVRLMDKARCNLLFCDIFAGTTMGQLVYKFMYLDHVQAPDEYQLVIT